MTTTTSKNPLSLAVRLYSALLVAYPKTFRHEYGYDMVQVFRTEYRVQARTGSWLSWACFWLATLTDLAITAVEEWSADKRGPRRFLRALLVGLLAGLMGGAIAGLGARFAMRGVANDIGRFPVLTFEGTLAVIIIGAIMGAPFGVIYVTLRSLLPGTGRWHGITYGILLFTVFLAPPLVFYREGEAVLGNPGFNVLVFAPLALVYGLIVQHIVAHFEPQGSLIVPRVSHNFMARVPQTLWFVVFVSVLELAVLGIASVLSPAPVIPLAILRASFELGIPLYQYPEVNTFLINLFALGYFGISSVIFWRRSLDWMARFTALALFLFGGALFNTGADYYVGLVADRAALQLFFHAVQVIGCSSLLALLCLFPHGQFAPTWTRGLMGVWSVWALVWLIIPVLPEALVFTILIGFFGAGLIAQAQRYRATAPESRPPLRLPFVGFAIAVASFAVVAALLIALPEFRPYNVGGLSMTGTFSFYMLPWLCIPLSIGYAVRRHHLWQQIPQNLTGFHASRL